MAKVVGIKIVRPLPYGRSVECLVEQLTDHIVKARPAVGDRFPSDAQLARLSGLSRPTVRKALDILHRQGWIERRHGLGTFIGQRAAIKSPAPPMRSTNGVRVVRLAIAASAIVPWYSIPIIEAVEARAAEEAIHVELLGGADGDARAMARRISQSRPDVVACLGLVSTLPAIVGETSKLRIPCIVTGMEGQRYGLASVSEDGRQGTRLAVEHLREAGHTRIGIILRFGGAPYVFERHQGYTEAMEAAGLDTDGLILWIPDHGYHRPAHDEFTSQLFKFIESKKPSALIAGTRKTTERLAELVTAGQLRVPEDLSIVGFQSTPSLPWIPGRHPTTIALPLREMGTRLASLARRVADGEKGSLELLPCELRPGTSVGPPKRRESRT